MPNTANSLTHRFTLVVPRAPSCTLSPDLQVWDLLEEWCRQHLGATVPPPPDRTPTTPFLDTIRSRFTEDFLRMETLPFFVYFPLFIVFLNG